MTTRTIVCHNCQHRMPVGPPPLDELAAMLDAGRTPMEIAEHFGCSAKTVRSVLLHSGRRLPRLADGVLDHLRGAGRASRGSLAPLAASCRYQGDFDVALRWCLDSLLKRGRIVRAAGGPGDYELVGQDSP